MAIFIGPGHIPMNSWGLFLCTDDFGLDSAQLSGTLAVIDILFCVVSVSPDCLLVQGNSANLVQGMPYRMSSVRSFLFG